MNEESIWTNFARVYDNILRVWDLYSELKDSMIKHLKIANIILDQGCGTGIFAIELAKQGKLVYGIDNNEYMLAKAIENGKDVKEGLYLKEGDALELEFKDNFFDGVISNNVIFYVNDPYRLLKEAYRVLKTQGVLTISGPRPNPDISKLTEDIISNFQKKGIYDIMRKDLEYFIECSKILKESGMPHTYELQDMRRLLQEIGFSRELELRDDLYLGQSFLVAVQKE